MNDLLRRLLIATTVMIPVFYFINENPFDTTSFLSFEEKQLVSWQRARMQVNPGSKKHLKTFKDMQRNSEPLKNVNPRVLIGVPPVEKKLLTIGMASVQRPQGTYLFDTLRSLFFTSSPAEQKYFIVLVHLADTDRKWLNRMISNISTLFKPYIQARQLVVISTPRTSYLPLKNLKKNVNDVAFHSKQNMDHAFLMNFATNYSDYFMMIEDAVKCAPEYITQIVTIISACERKFWITLEFSQLSFTGKLFHSKDLPFFVHFLLLFYHEMPYDHLLSHFHNLTQKKSIHYSPPLFQHVGHYTSFQDKWNALKDKEFEKNDIGSPNNPAATFYTNLDVTDNSILKNAYSLDTSFFYVKEAKVGSHLTVILDTPATVFRVQVLTGYRVRQVNQLKEGQVELGYDTTNKVNDCDDYILLGMLVNGVLDKQVLYEESGKKVKCVRLLVTATLSSGLIIRNINLWTKE